MLRWMLVAAAVLAAGGYLWAAGHRLQRGMYLLKPLTTLLILAVAVVGGLGGNRYGVWIAVGLIASLAGDIFLMLPNRFPAGLAAFLLAHLAYVVAFTPRLAMAGADVATLAVLAVAAGFLGQPFRNGLRRRGEAGLWGAVRLYMLVISVMLWRAWAGLWHPGLVPAPALTAAGALLFYLSDSILAWDRFVRSLPARDALVMIPYYGGQLLLALSVAPAVG